MFGEVNIEYTRIKKCGNRVTSTIMEMDPT